jgi:hypothetical protein
MLQFWMANVTALLCVRGYANEASTGRGDGRSKALQKSRATSLKSSSMGPTLPRHSSKFVAGCGPPRGACLTQAQASELHKVAARKGMYLSPTGATQRDVMGSYP